MLEYLPLLVTFLLALVGLVLKTTRDPDGHSLRKPLTRAGRAVLLLLSLAFILGALTTHTRRKAARDSNAREAARYSRDSTTWASQLNVARAQRQVQDTVLQESRSAAVAQIRLLDSTLAASGLLADQLGALTDSLRAQGAELGRTLQAQQHLLSRETDRLRNPIATPEVSITMLLPPIATAKSAALRLLQEAAPDSVRQRTQRLVLDSEYSYSDAQLTSFGQAADLFPGAIYITLWPSKNGTCSLDSLVVTQPAIDIIISANSPANWHYARRWSDRPVYHLDGAEVFVENDGILSLSELRGGCFGVHLDLNPAGQNWFSNERHTLFQAIWLESTMARWSLDFGGGREFNFSFLPHGVSLPLSGRLPNQLPWESPSSSK